MVMLCVGELTQSNLIWETGNERPRKLACYGMEREHLADVTVDPTDLITHLIVKVKMVRTA
jgi:hypothetical protein